MKYKIVGNGPLSGLVNISGSKKSALKILAASIISDGVLEISNVPAVGDVLTFIEILKSLGVYSKFRSDGVLEINPSNLNSYKLPSFAKGVEFSVLFVAPLLAKFGKAILPKDTNPNWGPYFKILKSKGVTVKKRSRTMEFECASFNVSEISLPADVFMGTDIAILSSVLAEGDSVISNAAEDPEVDELITVLNKMGAKIKRLEQNPKTVSVEGVRSLGGAEHTIIPDRNEAVFYAVAAVFTNGDLIIRNLDPTHLTSFLSKLSFIGVGYEVASQNEVRVWLNVGNDLKPASIETKPYPGFMNDWQPVFSVLLTKSNGESSVVDKTASRFEFAKELNRMGAKIEFSGSAIRILGPTPLRGTAVEALDAVSGAALIVAGLGAKGKTKVHNAEIIDNEFENIEKKLKDVGADIVRTA